MKGKRKLKKENRLTKQVICIQSKLTKVSKKKLKRTIPVPKKQVGFLPLFFPILVALGALDGDAAGIAVNDAILFKKFPIKLPSHALTNSDLDKYTKKISLHSQATFCRDELSLKSH